MPMAGERFCPMFTKILIANRGEIACRVIRTARRMGVRTVAVFSEADANARHVRLADEAVCIGPPAARDSYLVAERMLDAVRRTGAQAVHPGYGFLSENERFADACAAAGIVFIGPPAAAIRAMGSKSAAKTLMAAAGVPLTPGYHGDEQEADFLHAQADAIGYPVLIKAAAGGGGKGMRLVEKSDDFAAALASCRREAISSFASDQVLIEKYLRRSRHIEIQIFADTLGNCVHLFERDCSVQRRHQKVLEEAPAPGMTPARRAVMGQAAVDAARAVGYVGAGTVEFIASDTFAQDGNFYFMEMNTRLQVEHPVTEMITGQDLVEWQLRVASGEPLPLRQEQLDIRGHALEARIYAENPDQQFLPSTGRLLHLARPAESLNVRVDTGIEQGDEITPYYDPMIAKLIVHEGTREAAAERLAEAAEAVEVYPVKTNAAFLARCLRHPRFIAGDVDTGFIAAEESALSALPLSAAGLQGAARLLRLSTDEVGRRDHFTPWGAWSGPIGLRLNAAPVLRQTVFVDGDPTVLEIDDSVFAHHGHLEPDTSSTVYFDRGRPFQVSMNAPRGVAAAGASDGALRAPMPGRIVATPVKSGDTVAKGQTVVVLEAMKMEHALTAPFDGVVDISVSVGDQAPDGAVLATISAEGEA